MSDRFTAEHAAERERVLSAAYAEGKFPASRRQHYAAMYDNDPHGTTALLAQMAAGLPPADAEAYPPQWVGAHHTPAQASAPAPAPSRPSGPVTDEAYPPEWLGPQARRGGGPDPITVEMEGADAAVGADA
jgi:hypothetical protein